MNTYVVMSHRYGGKQQRDRIVADTMAVSQEDPEIVVIFDDEEGNVIGVVRDFDAVYLESSVQLADTETE